MKRLSSIILPGIVACFLLLPLTAATAKNPIKIWNAKLQEHLALPSSLIAVDKTKQQLVVLNGSGISAPQTYICTTGQATGDKQVQGDLKTPEGIYFVNTHLASGLDYFMYGNEAYTLNYPNPVDKLRRKTGYGIWIHGKGEPIKPLLTQGCVAMQNDDLASIGEILAPGTPVTLANSLDYDATPAEADLAKIAKLTQKVENWTIAWSNRSDTFFEFYDAKAYSASTEDFVKFKAQKSRLFKSLEWIKTEATNIQVLQGPGYWVTWFAQDYAASNLSIKGVRRLYWYETKNGDFQIVGMEWLPNNYIPTQAMYVALAKQPPHYGLQQSERIQVAEAAAPQTEAATLTTDSSSVEKPVSTGENDQQTTIVNELLPLTPATETVTEADIITVATNNSQSIKPTATPAIHNTKQQLQPQGMVALASTEPVKTPSPSLDKLYASTDIILDAADKDTAQQEIVKARVEEWRKVWESGDLTKYLEFYSPEATQGGILSKEKIALHKTRLWQKIAPQQITVSDIRVKINGEQAIAQMTQEYLATDGSGDLGTKTLYLHKVNGSWLIIKEEWRAQ